VRSYGRAARWRDRILWFVIGCVFLIVSPLLPLAAELMVTRRITVLSMTLVATLYAISLTTSCRTAVSGWAGIIVGLVCGVSYGFSLGIGEDLRAAVTLYDGVLAATPWMTAVGCGIGFVLLMHLGERFSAHVLDGEPFPDFTRTRS
jgi:hypothetical protein